MPIVYLEVGSNLGNRRANIVNALKAVKVIEGTEILKISRLIESEPVGGPGGQRKYLNGAVKIKTSLTPFRLLKALKRIEHHLGRKRAVRFGPRCIDIDILLYNNKIINSGKLAVPHPRMWQRQFVLRTLCEIL